MPPLEPQEGINTLKQQVNKVFAGSTTLSLGVQPSGAQYSSNAPLDAATLRNVLRSVMGKNVQLSTLDVTVSATECQVLYAVDRAIDSPRNDRILVQISQCRSASDAGQKMQEHLQLYQRDLSSLGRAANVGSHSLRTDDSILWVRDTIYASVFLDTINDGSVDPEVGPEPVARDFDFGDSPFPSGNHSVLKVAQRIDQHVAEHQVLAASQLIPRIALQTPNPMHVKAGERFTVKLRDAYSLSDVKRSTTSNNLVIPTDNGNDLAEFGFFAMQAGRTKVTVIVAHETSLAVASLDVDVIIHN